MKIKTIGSVEANEEGHLHQDIPMQKQNCQLQPS